MNIYLLWDKENKLFLQLVDFLSQRNHLVVNKELIFSKEKISNNSYFEQVLALRKKSDWLIAHINKDFNFGFELGYLSNSKTKTILFFPVKKDVCGFVSGCTFANFYQKEYQSWNDIRKYLSLFGL